ncbi:UDP-glucose/GDP-mannose dehydrogenase family protein [Listeria booriae]|uniref:UDP-glucose dehydrogenase family protein n=1 Tax=Listeria booriae TaxID=1552123 RepID=UPI0016287C1D|nr:UDP-glucose/GDP-mannose dehydrogenase family protein [Listeria booriae]MBC1559668.1 UDP-glucose/GDP-mannose dehydrogenase family protein [Listeria booriae]
MNKIAVAGVGYVGLVTGVCLAEKGQQVICVDTDSQKISQLNQGTPTIYEPGLQTLLHKNIAANRLTFTTMAKEAYIDADVIFICVGTPEQADGSANLNYVYQVATTIAQYAKENALIVIKSTVPIGTNEKLKEFFRAMGLGFEVASNPEFLAQGSAIRDTLAGHRIVLGVESERAERLLKSVYAAFEQPFVVTDLASAEMVKYAANDFLALKISFVNDIANLCERVGANIEDVTKGIGYDPRIGDQFLRAGIGYGGSCFPKDTKALHWLAEEEGYILRTVKAAIDVNEKQKYKLLQLAKQEIDTFRGKKVAVLGLTFKPETDDLRESPALPNIQMLLAEGAEIRAYDPAGMERARVVLGDGIRFVNSAKEALEQAEICFIFTDWAEMKALTPNDFITGMRRPLIFDGRNCFDMDVMRAVPEIRYVSIGRPKTGVARSADMIL